jgi:hypothetical protein
MSDVIFPLKPAAGTSAHLGLLSTTCMSQLYCSNHPYASMPTWMQGSQKSQQQLGLAFFLSASAMPWIDKCMALLAAGGGELDDDELLAMQAEADWVSTWRGDIQFIHVGCLFKQTRHCRWLQFCFEHLACLGEAG